MAVIKVFTNDGQLVDTREVDDKQILSNGVGQWIYGRAETPLGWLGRALRDADYIQRGLDPELPSEKVMRLLAEGGKA